MSESYCKKIGNLEKKLALELIEGFSLSGDKFLNPFIDECLKRNNDLELLSSGIEMAVIGAGSIPSTIIKASQLGLFKRYHAFDIDPEARVLGAQILRNLNLKGEYSLSDGKDVDFGAFDIVYIANLVQGKREVLERCFLTCRKDAQVVLRLSSKVDGSDVDGFNVEDIEKEKWIVERLGETSQEFQSFNCFLRRSNQS